MNHLYLILILATFACANNLSENDNHIQASTHIQPRIYEDKIKEIIKDLLEKIGDPAILENQELKLEISKLKLNITATGTITGLQGLDIQVLKLSLVGLKFNFDVFFPSLDVNISSYHMKAFVGKLPLFGDGTLRVTAKNIRITGSGKLGSKDGSLFLQKLDLTPGLKLTNFFFKITGFAHNANTSNNLSQFVNEVVPELLNDMAAMANKNLAALIMKLVEGKTFNPFG